MGMAWLFPVFPIQFLAVQTYQLPRAWYVKLYASRGQQCVIHQMNSSLSTIPGMGRYVLMLRSLSQLGLGFKPLPEIEFPAGGQHTGAVYESTAGLCLSDFFLHDNAKTYLYNDDKK